MKKMTTIWMMIFMLNMSIPAMGAMSISKMRENARFITDKMTHELGLSMMQYDDVYEVNYDFINNVRYIMDDVVRGNGYAIERYYEFLDYRNDDLRWILSHSQYVRFMNTDYFFRPIYITPSNWTFRIFKVYTDVKHFFYGKPKHYKSYRGEHFRTHHNNVSFYQKHRKDIYKHDVYKGKTKVERKPAAQKKKDIKPANRVKPKKTEAKKQTPAERPEKASEKKQTETKKESARTNNRSNNKEQKRSAVRTAEGNSSARSGRR